MQHSSYSFKFSPTAFAVIAACVVATGGALLYAGASRAADEPKAAAQPRPALAVTTTVPQASQVPVRLAANGSIAAWQEAIIGSESNGLRLTEVRVNVGDVVKAGQVLATFAADTVQAEVAQARASLLEAQASAAEAAANAERARSLQAVPMRCCPPRSRSCGNDGTQPEATTPHAKRMPSLIDCSGCSSIAVWRCSINGRGMLHLLRGSGIAAPQRLALPYW